jgi:DNA-binding MarR family transcriptional regulator
MATAAPEPDDARRLLHHIRALVRRFAISERADVFCCGMTIAQAATLETLRLEGALRMGELGKRLGIMPSTLTRNLQRLLDAGYVKREADDADGRAAVIALTASGRRQADKLERQEEWFAEEILDRIDPGHRDAVVARLGDLLIAVRAATKSCCPEGAFDHLMTGFPPGDARLKDAGLETRSCDGGECE